MEVWLFQIQSNLQNIRGQRTLLLQRPNITHQPLRQVKLKSFNYNDFISDLVSPGKVLNDVINNLVADMVGYDQVHLIHFVDDF